MNRFSYPVLAVLFLLWMTGMSVAAVPNTMTYQGRLTDSVGTPLNATVSITFVIYDAETNGNKLWEETQLANVQNGIFTIALGSVTPFTETIISGPDRYVGIKVGTDAEMIPRQKINSVAFAGKASVADSVSGGGVNSAAIENGSITPDKLADTCSPGQVLIKGESGWQCATLALGGAMCNQGDFVSCYSGPANTKGVGSCTAGIRICEVSGVFGGCVGEVLPSTETCNNIDDDCNDVVDDGPNIPTWYRDSDSDMYGDVSDSRVSCTKPLGYVASNADCNDADNTVNPSMVELCDSIDNDCNSQIDDSCINTTCSSAEKEKVINCSRNSGALGDPDWFYECMNIAGISSACQAASADLSECAFGTCGPANISTGCARLVCPDLWPFGPDCKTGTTRACGPPEAGIGECKLGTETCVGGFWNGTCEGAVYGEGYEICDGKDNNCNGFTDESGPYQGPLCGEFGTCINGACQCAGRSVLCLRATEDGIPAMNVCTDILSDPSNCGACGNNCAELAPSNTASFCSYGVCSSSSCIGGFMDCDGDPVNGCEADLTDPVNCGSCGGGVPTAPNADTACIGGAPAITSCHLGYEDCNGDMADGCEVNILNDPNNCGSCGNNQLDDGNICNGVETCIDGAVVSPGLDCDDGISCTIDGCDINSGCIHTPNDIACEDGNVCTINTCDLSGCVNQPFTGYQGDDCYTGPVETLGVGMCSQGYLTCQDGVAVCSGEVVPTAEVCDGIDNDCNGFPDDGC